MTLEVKNLRINRKKSIISNLTKIEHSDGHVAAGIYPYSYLAYIHDVRSPMLPLILSYRFATSEKRVLQVRADFFFSNWGIAYSVIKRHTYANLVANNLQ